MKISILKSIPVYSLIIGLPLLFSNCGRTVDASTVLNVIGTYQLTGYNSPSWSDDNPSGTVSVTQVDDQHVNIIVKGTSGKIKINYSYQNVSVVMTTPANQDQDMYTLLYKGRQMGIAGSDYVSRYIDIYPSSTITIKGLEL